MLSGLVDGIFKPEDFPGGSYSLGFFNPGRKDLYSPWAAGTTNWILGKLTQEMPIKEIIDRLANGRWQLAAAMHSDAIAIYLDEDAVKKVNSFGHYRYLSPTRPLAPIDGYSEFFLFQDAEELKEQRKWEIFQFFDSNKASFTETSHPSRSRAIFIDRSGRSYGQNKITRASGPQIGASELVEITHLLNDSAPLRKIIVIHPDPEISKLLFEDAIKIVESLRDQPSSEKFLQAMYAYYNSVPFHRGSALIGNIFFDALYYFLWKKKPPLSGDERKQTDAFAMLSPNFETFRKALNDRWFPRE
jgi:hypothetical protein